MNCFTDLLKTISCAAVISFSLVINSRLYAQEMTAEEILNTMQETMNPEQAQGIMEMTIITSSGDERTFKYETYSKDQGEKSLMKYLLMKYHLNVIQQRAFCPQVYLSLYLLMKFQ